MFLRLVSLRLVSACLASLLLVAAPAGAQTVRFKSRFIDVGSIAGSGLYRQWGRVVAQQIRSELDAIISDLQPTPPWDALNDFDFDFVSSPSSMTLSARTKLWRELGLLEIIEGVPFGTENEVHATVTIFMGELAGPLSSTVFRQDEDLKADATPTASNVFVLITLYALIENAKSSPQADRLVCVLAARANSFARDIVKPPPGVPAPPASAKRTVDALMPVLSQRQKEHSCPLVG